MNLTKIIRLTLLQNDFNVPIDVCDSVSIALQASGHASTSPKPKPKTAKRESFVRPCSEEVTDYGIGMGITIDGDEFCDFYSSKGWKVGNSPMKNWKACVRTWAKRERKTKAKPQKLFFEDIKRMKYLEHELDTLRDLQQLSEDAIKMRQEYREELAQLKAKRDKFIKESNGI